MGGSDNQVFYNYALLEGVNEQLAALKHRVCHFDHVCDAPSVCACACVSVCFSTESAVLGRWSLGIASQHYDLPTMGAHASLIWHGQAWFKTGKLCLRVNSITRHLQF